MAAPYCPGTCGRCHKYECTCATEPDIDYNNLVGDRDLSAMPGAQMCDSCKMIHPSYPVPDDRNIPYGHRSRSRSRSPANFDRRQGRSRSPVRRSRSRSPAYFRRNRSRSRNSTPGYSPYRGNSPDYVPETPVRNRPEIVDLTKDDNNNEDDGGSNLNFAVISMGNIKPKPKLEYVGDCAVAASSCFFTLAYKQLLKCASDRYFGGEYDAKLNVGQLLAAPGMKISGQATRSTCQIKFTLVDALEAISSNPGELDRFALCEYVEDAVNMLESLGVVFEAKISIARC